MGLIYTHIRLWWDGRTGWAQYGGVQRRLEAVPEIDVMQQIYELDYSPELHVAEVRERACDRKRDMEEHEQRAALRWLEAFSDAVKRNVGLK